MGRRSNYQKTDLSSIPSEFDLDKYDFKDDSELWFAALTLRFELKKEVEEFLAWGVADDEFSEQRLELRDDAISRLQKKILLLMDKPCSLNSDNSARPPELRHATAWAETRKDQVSQFWGESQVVSDRLIVDEFRSAAKLQDDGYKRIFDKEIKNLIRKRERFFSSGLFGIPLKPEHGEKPSVGEASHYVATYSMWRADIQTPNFSGEFGVKVNLFHDDDVLISEFAKWLKATRAAAVPHFSTNKGITTATLKEWADMRLIPYLDLWLYQKIFGVTFTFPNIGEILFQKPDDPGKPKKEDGSDWTKRAKDTHKRAIELTSPLSFYALRKSVFAKHKGCQTKALSWEEMPGFLHRLDGFYGEFATACYIRLMIWAATRPGEARGARWEEFDLEKACWTIPAERMKLRQAHRVPLPQQAISMLKELNLLTGSKEYLFPSQVGSKANTLSYMALLRVIRKSVGRDDVDAHVFRAVFRTHAEESLLWDESVLEAALAHRKKNAAVGAYDRVTRYEARKKLMQWYADELDRVKKACQA